MGERASGASRIRRALVAKTRKALESKKASLSYSMDFVIFRYLLGMLL
jgi:hypothetical protein